MSHRTPGVSDPTRRLESSKRWIHGLSRRSVLGSVIVLSAVLPCRVSIAKDNFGTLPRDRSKPVARREEIVSAWQKRQNSIHSFRFAWTERQVHPRGWLPNPRFPEREWLNIPGLLIDRTYAVSKTLAVDGNRMRYTFELDRKQEPDGVVITSPGGPNNGFGEGKHYRYVGSFNGTVGRTSITDLTGGIPPVFHESAVNTDAQNLDTRPILMAFRPLDPVMGHLLIDRAVTNLGRNFFKGRSTMILEERRDPSGWKTSLWIEPERDFLVNRYHVLFEQHIAVEMDIDYVKDARWGWIPTRWQIVELLADGSLRLVSEATVTSYSINEPIAAGEFDGGARSP